MTEPAPPPPPVGQWRRFWRRLLWRLAPSLAGLLVYIGFAAIWRFNTHVYHAVLAAFDTVPDIPLFGDMTSVLSAVSCAQQGVDVYARNACMGGGSYNYSTFLLDLGGLFPLGPGQGVAAGLFTGGVLLGALLLLPPARSGRELALRIAAMGSSMFVLAMETANIDDLIFVAVLCAVLALRHGIAGRVFGYAMFGLLSAIKFYPAVLMALSIREKKSTFWPMCLVGAALAAVYVWHFGAGMITALALLPGAPPYTYMFGAQNLATGIAVLLGVPHSSLIEPVTIGLVALALFAAWREARQYGAALLAIGEAERLLLLAGAMIVPESFFLTQNGDYRCLFFLLTLPGLCAMARAAPALTGKFNAAGLAVVFLMWEPLARFLTAALGGAVFGNNGVWLRMAFWLIRELVWWRVCIFLTALVFAYAAARWPALLPARRTA